MTTMKVLIADDHNVVREGLKPIMETHYGRVTFADARDGAEALNRIWKEEWDLVLLDIHMPGRDGLEVLRETRKAPTARASSRNPASPATWRSPDLP